MVKAINYEQKFNSYLDKTLFRYLDPEQQEFTRELAFKLRLTFQEFRQLVEMSRDISMWAESDIIAWWRESGLNGQPVNANSKKVLLQKLQAYVQDLKRSAKIYPANGLPRPPFRAKKPIYVEKTDKKVFGQCPVASEKTVCCNLHTIDAVENCAFGCSYCTIQTFYSDQFIFDADFADKLKAIPIDPNRFYHFGTGQSSDSLVWGNRYGILDALCKFAADHPNVLLEFKTKSDNVQYLLENKIPANIVCSWSLNTPTIIQNEEHFTASLEKRIHAARQVADRGIKVAFHFHPMVYYAGWQKDYPAIAKTLLNQFTAEEVLFISYGSVTFIKPVIQKIRKLGHQTKTLQMDMVQDPHGKLTYPDELKIRMFKTMHRAFAPWHDRVFFYLCMEKALIWQETFGFVYEDNEEFERDFGRKTMVKVGFRPAEFEAEIAD